MALTRRQLMVLAAAAATTGCKREDGRAASLSTPPATAGTPAGSGFDAGPVSAFKEDDVYTDHRWQ